MYDRLALMLDALLPGGEGFPLATDIDLAGWMRAHPDWAKVADAVLSALPEGFAEAPSVSRQAMLRAAEKRDPELFGRMLVGAYSGYYVNPAVRAVIEQRTGYPDRPPQPRGYDLKPFDPALLDTMRQRPSSYRKA
jgi:hypothetical protein